MHFDFADDFDDQIRKATAHLNQSIPVPIDGSEDEAVDAVIREYRQRTGVELEEAVIRAEVRRLRADAGGS